jgi:hypothetical protein
VNVIDIPLKQIEVGEELGAALEAFARDFTQ